MNTAHEKSGVEMKRKQSASMERPTEPSHVAMIVALECLSILLRYATEEGYMDDYQAQCTASQGIQALAFCLPAMDF